jgi:fructokinase
MNVAYHLSKFGKNPAVISRIGNDELGNELLQTMKEKGINTEYVQTDVTLPTSTVVARLKDNHEMVYDIVQNVAWDNIMYDALLSDIVKGADYFVFGSLAARSARTRATLFQLLEIAKTKVLDINLRAPHYSRELIETMLAKADIVKLNEAELKLITEWFTSYKSDEESIAFLQEKFSIHMVIVTKGAEGALLKAGHTLYSHEGYHVVVADTVGSGDSFLAGVIFQLMDHIPYEHILDFANKLGAFITTQKGACPVYQLNEVTTSSFIRRK